MPRIIVITNPAHDIPTSYLNAWIFSVIQLFVDQENIEIHELANQRANRCDLEKLIREKQPQIILFHGHGTSNAILGFESNILICCDSDLSCIKDRIIHSLACQSGKELGPKSVHIGTKSFIGYKEDFKFSHLNKSSRDEQLGDEVAKLFLDPAFEIARVLINGGTTGEAYKNSQKLCIDNLRMLVTAKNDSLNGLASYLYHNLTNQVCLGDTKASALGTP
jgi:hypothetical protein